MISLDLNVKVQGGHKSNLPAGRPGVVHAHAQVDFPFTRADLHGPHKGSWNFKCSLCEYQKAKYYKFKYHTDKYHGIITSIAGDGHGACDPPGEDEHPVPRGDGGDEAEDDHGDAGNPDTDLPPEAVGDEAGTEGTQNKT